MIKLHEQLDQKKKSLFVFPLYNDFKNMGHDVYLVEIDAKQGNSEQEHHKTSKEQR